MEENGKSINNLKNVLNIYFDKDNPRNCITHLISQSSNMVLFYIKCIFLIFNLLNSLAKVGKL